MKEICVVLKPNIKTQPPVMSLLHALVHLNFKTTFICGNLDTDIEDNIKQLGITVYNLRLNNKSDSFLKKIIFFLKFRLSTFRIINKIYHINNTLIWVASGDTAFALGFKIKKYNYILNLFELYDRFPVRRLFFKNLSKKAFAVVVSEYTRACILKIWWGLKTIPYVLPNKPNYLSKIDFANPPIHIQKIIKYLENQKKTKKIILYQGFIGADRAIDVVAESCKQLSDYCLVLLGKDTGYLAELKKINPDIVHIEHIEAPYHLYVTQQADIGIVYYSFLDLNNIFCAPNKSWEYANFGIPMIGNNIPGLNSIIKINNTGEIMEHDTVPAFIECVKSIEKNIQKYSKGSLDFFASVDYEKSLNYIINNSTYGTK